MKLDIEDLNVLVSVEEATHDGYWVTVWSVNGDRFPICYRRGMTAALTVAKVLKGVLGSWEGTRMTTWQAPNPQSIVVWYEGAGWYVDAWDGLYPSATEALADSAGGLTHMHDAFHFPRHWQTEPWPMPREST